MADRLFLDTSFVQALLSRRDAGHVRALALVPSVEAAEIVVTEAVLLEIANAMSRDVGPRRRVAVLIASYYDRPDCTVAARRGSPARRPHPVRGPRR